MQALAGIPISFAAAKAFAPSPAPFAAPPFALSAVVSKTHMIKRPASVRACASAPVIRLGYPAGTRYRPANS
jgi:hypothetical protein